MTKPLALYRLDAPREPTPRAADWTVVVDDLDDDDNNEHTTLVIGAGGRTGSRVLRLMAGMGLPVIGIAQAPERVAPYPALRPALLVSADLNVDAIAPWVDAARHVVYVAGADPCCLDDAAIFRQEVLALSRVLDAATRARLAGSFIYVGAAHSLAPVPSWRPAWLAAKRSAESMLSRSGLHHLILYVPPLTDNACPDPRLHLGGQPEIDAPLSREALASMIVGALVARHATNLHIEVRPAGDDGMNLHQAVTALSRMPHPLATNLRNAPVTRPVAPHWSTP